MARGIKASSTEVLDSPPNLISPKNIDSTQITTGGAMILDQKSTSLSPMSQQQMVMSPEAIDD